MIVVVDMSVQTEKVMSIETQVVQVLMGQASPLYALGVGFNFSNRAWICIVDTVTVWDKP